MPNHVSFQIRILEMNDAAKEKFTDITNRIRNPEEGSYGYRCLGDIFVDGKNGTTYEDTIDRSWAIDNMDTKWAYVDDIYDDSITGYSAWDAPQGALRYILSELSLLDQNMITEFTYDDEMPNFYGAYVYRGDEEIDGFQESWQELVEFCEASFPIELGGKFDYEKLEWEDEDSESFFSEVMYEVMRERQYDFIQCCLKEENNG